METTLSKTTQTTDYIVSSFSPILLGSFSNVPIEIDIDENTPLRTGYDPSKTGQVETTSHCPVWDDLPFCQNYLPILSDPRIMYSRYFQIFLPAIKQYYWS